MQRKAVVAKGILLIVLSTVCYYIPVVVSGMGGFDISEIPAGFYNYYCWMMAGAFALNIIYATFLFVEIDSKKLSFKLPVLWLIIAESVTLAIHILDKFFRQTFFNGYEILIVFIFFTTCCTFFINRAITKPKSDKFDPRKTFIINYTPKNIFAIFSWLINHTGHKGIYQAGKIYKFRKRSGRVEQITFRSNLLRNNVAFNEVPEIKNIQKIVGKKYNLRKYNCRHMVKDAQS